MNREEKQLVLRIQARDEKAFEKLVTEYYPDLVEFAFHILDRSDEAEDAVENVFRKIWEKAEKWNPEKSMKSFLFRSTKNEALNLMRTRRHHKNIEDFIHLAQPAGKSPDEILYKKQRHATLHKAIDSLPEKYRIPLILLNFMGFSYKKIAEILDLDEKAVGRRIYKAMTILRQKFEQLTRK